MLADDAKMQVVEEQLAERQLLLPFDADVKITTAATKEKTMNEIVDAKIKAAAKKRGPKSKPVDPKLAAAQKEIARLKSVIASMTLVYKDVNKERLELAARLAKVAVAINPKSKKGPKTKKA